MVFNLTYLFYTVSEWIGTTTNKRTITWKWQLVESTRGWYSKSVETCDLNIIIFCLCKIHKWRSNPSVIVIRVLTLHCNSQPCASEFFRGIYKTENIIHEEGKKHDIVITVSVWATDDTTFKPWAKPQTTTYIGTKFGIPVGYRRALSEHF